MYPRLTALILGISLLASCGLFQSKSSNPEVARVGDEYLYLSDIDDLTFDLNAEDSAELANSYIDTWIKEKLLLQKAMQNLSESQVDFERQLENYRKSLIIYAYENQLIKQKLDTNVSPAQLLAYYRQNKSNFELKNDVLIARFLKCLNSAPNQDSIPYWFELDLETSNAKLTEYCAQFTIRCDIDTSNWLAKSSFMNYFPKALDVSTVELQAGQFYRYADSLETIYVQVIDYRNKGDFAPVKYVSTQIEEIVRNKRRLELLSRVKEEIFEEATIKRKYEVFKIN